MVSTKLISQTITAASIAGFVLVTANTSADTTTIGVINPLLGPLQQGWKMGGNYPQIDVATNGAFITANTIGVTPGPNLDAVQLFYNTIPILVEENYAVDLWLKVNEVPSPHIPAPENGAPFAGLVFYASTTTARLVQRGYPNEQMIWFDEDAIGWGDESGQYAMDTTDEFHHYRIELASDGTARVLVDGELALQRSDFKVYPHLAFGDTARAGGVDSNYSISSITVTGQLITPVPVDMRPEICPNDRLNGKSTKSIPIAIVGTPDFDVTKIDPSTVRIRGLSPKGWRLRDAARPVQPYIGKEFTDTCTRRGADGRLDLVVAFEEGPLARALGYLYFGDVLRVTGKLKPEYGGHAFAGEDFAEVYNIP